MPMMIGRELNLFRAPKTLMNSFVEFVVVNFQLGLGSQLGLCEVGFWVKDDVIRMIHH